jgi:hypothetical protein
VVVVDEIWISSIATERERERRLVKVHRRRRREERTGRLQRGEDVGGGEQMRGDDEERGRL